MKTDIALTDFLKDRMTEFDTMSIAEKQEAALQAVGEFNRLARRSVQEAWVAGGMLQGVKAYLSHGEFRPWLESVGIAERTARRFMELHRKVEIGQLGRFASVQEALKSPADSPSEPTSERPAHMPEHIRNMARPDLESELDVEETRHDAGIREALRSQWELGKLLTEAQDRGMTLPEGISEAEATEARRLYKSVELDAIEDLSSDLLGNLQGGVLKWITWYVSKDGDDPRGE